MHDVDAHLPGLLAEASRIAQWMARRAGSPWLGDELESAALTGLACACRTWRPDGVAFPAWARARMRDHARDALRDWRGRHSPKIEAATTVEEFEHAAAHTSSADDPERRALARIDLVAVAEAFAALPEHQRAAVLSVPSGLTLEGEAARRGVNPGTVAVLRHRALRKLARAAA